MQRIKILGLALVAVCAASALASASAFAAPEWLLNGAAISEPTAVSSKSVGKLLLADLGVGTVILCEGTDKGTVGPGSMDLVKEISATSCTFDAAGSCDSSKPVTAKAVNLPWLTTLYLEGTEIRDDITSEISGKLPGWVVECTVAGIFKIQDECTGLATTGMDNVAGIMGGVDALFDALTPEAACTKSSGKQGMVRGTVLNENPLIEGREEKLTVMP
jgi:hypothetical protein